MVEGVVHYCVTNMPGAVGEPAPLACNATLPYAVLLANKGYSQAAADDPGIAAGVNLVAGSITNQAVADSLGLPYRAIAVVV